MHYGTPDDSVLQIIKVEAPVQNFDVQGEQERQPDTSQSGLCAAPSIKAGTVTLKFTEAVTNTATLTKTSTVGTELAEGWELGLDVEASAGGTAAGITFGSKVSLKSKISGSIKTFEQQQDTRTDTFTKTFTVDKTQAVDYFCPAGITPNTRW